MKKTSSSVNNSRRRPKGRPARKRASGYAPNKSVQSKRMNRSVPLNLTATQFTATSPQNLFESRGGSTPGGIRVKGREYFASVSTGLSAGNVNINAKDWGVPFTATNDIGVTPGRFPRLRGIASIYEQYFFHKVKISFLSLMPTSQLGSLAFGVQFDSRAAVPTGADFELVVSQMISTIGNVYSDMAMEAPGTLANFNRYYIRDQIGEFADDRMVYQFNIQAVSSSSLPLTTSLGHLIIEYDVEFYTPQNSFSGSVNLKKSNLIKTESIETVVDEGKKCENTNCLDSVCCCRAEGLDLKSVESHCSSSSTNHYEDIQTLMFEFKELERRLHNIGPLVTSPLKGEGTQILEEKHKMI